MRQAYICPLRKLIRGSNTSHVLELKLKWQHDAQYQMHCIVMKRIKLRHKKHDSQLTDR